jgi:uncharacterized membrane protein (DUF373 family)
MIDPKTRINHALDNGRARPALEKMAGSGPRFHVYALFEQGVALVLLLLLSSIVVVGLIHLALSVKRDVFLPFDAPIDTEVFKNIFGTALTVLIGLELNHTMLSVLQRKESIVQLRTVVLVAIIAMARKVLVIDITELEPLVIIAFAFTFLVLGCVYWILRR